MILRLQKINNWKIGIVFSVLLSAFNLLNNSQYYSETNFLSILLSWTATFIFLIASWYVISFLFAFFEKSNKKISNLNKILILIVFTSILLGLFYIIGIYVKSELNIMATYKENVSFFIVLRGVVSIIFICIFQYALNTNKKAQEALLQNQKLKTENIMAQFEILRQQVNPHFLFNSLSTLRSMIRSNNKNAEIFILKLSEIYRQLLLKREKEVVSLKEELDFINDYMFMLLERYDTMLTLNIDIPGYLLKLKIPTFSLQLLLENCIKHNVISQDRPLKIKIFFTNPESLIIENNFQPKLTQSEKSGFGLQNLEQRYSLLGEPDGIHVFSDESVFRVKIKLLSV